MSGHGVWGLHLLLTAATPAPTDLVAVPYASWSTSGVDLMVCAVGMPCEAGSQSTSHGRVCVGHGQISVWYHEGKDATRCSLVVQPFLGLVCTSAMRSDSGIPTKSYELTCQFL